MLTKPRRFKKVYSISKSDSLEKFLNTPTVHMLDARTDGFKVQWYLPRLFIDLQRPDGVDQSLEYNHEKALHKAISLVKNLRLAELLIHLGEVKYQAGCTIGSLRKLYDAIEQAVNQPQRQDKFTPFMQAVLRGWNYPLSGFEANSIHSENLDKVLKVYIANEKKYLADNLPDMDQTTVQARLCNPITLLLELGATSLEQNEKIGLPLKVAFMRRDFELIEILLHNMLQDINLLHEELKSPIGFEQTKDSTGKVTGKHLFIMSGIPPNIEFPLKELSKSYDYVVASLQDSAEVFSMPPIDRFYEQNINILQYCVDFANYVLDSNAPENVRNSMRKQLKEATKALQAAKNVLQASLNQSENQNNIGLRDSGVPPAVAEYIPIHVDLERSPISGDHGAAEEEEIFDHEAKQKLQEAAVMQKYKQLEEKVKNGFVVYTAGQLENSNPSRPADVIDSNLVFVNTRTQVFKQDFMNKYLAALGDVDNIGLQKKSMIMSNKNTSKGTQPSQQRTRFAPELDPKKPKKTGK